MFYILDQENDAYLVVFPSEERNVVRQVSNIAHASAFSTREDAQAVIDHLEEDTCEPDCVVVEA